MNSKSNHNNVFRFSLYQGSVDNKKNANGSIETIFTEEVLLSEKVFNADNYNPFTRYSIDIRDILRGAISSFQKILSRKRYDVIVDVGNGIGYDLLKYNSAMINSYPREWRESMRYNPRSQKLEIEDKVIRGVPCKIGLYINDNPIVERVFYVDGFNYVARHSTDVTETLVDVVFEISEQIKKVDVKNMWDDYDLINKRGLNMNQIRELSPGKRAYLIRSMN